MSPAEARAHALKASLELRLGHDTPAVIIARAKEFESYIAAPDYSAPTRAQGDDKGNPEKASAATFAKKRT